EAARMPGARPVAVMQVEGCEFRQEVVEGLSGKRIAQDFRNHHRRQRQLATLDSGGDAIDVFSGLALEEGRQGTCVAGDHSRSYLSSSRLMANLTLPRSLRRSCCAFIWASFFSAARTVSVTPSPVSSCALARSALGTSTVIFFNA